MKKWKRRLYAAFVCVILLAGSMRAYAAETTRFTLPVSYTWGKDGLIAGKKISGSFKCRPFGYADAGGQRAGKLYAGFKK